MLYKLKCKNCGFKFVLFAPDDMTEEEETEIKTCPCGEIMEHDDMLDPINVIEISANDGE